MARLVITVDRNFDDVFQFKYFLRRAEKPSEQIEKFHQDRYPYSLYAEIVMQV